MGGSERSRELRRRRHRKKKVTKLVQRLDKANSATKAAIAGKLRNLTPGAETIIQTHSIED